MKIVIVGATGTIGSAIVKELSPRHEIVKVGKSSGDFQVDIADPSSIKRLFDKIGSFDALICAAGNVHFGPFSEMTHDLYNSGLQDKLLGQVNLVLLGRDYINENGSFTLTSGILSHDPIRGGSSASMVNGAIDSFVKAASIELTRGIRINSISPTILAESLHELSGSYASLFRGFDPVPAAKVALAYSKSVEGLKTGQVFNVGSH